MQEIINTVSQYAAQAGQSIVQWIQSPSGQHMLKHCGIHIAKELSKLIR